MEQKASSRGELARSHRLAMASTKEIQRPTSKSVDHVSKWHRRQPASGTQGMEQTNNDCEHTPAVSELDD